MSDSINTIDPKAILIQSTRPFVNQVLAQIDLSKFTDNNPISYTNLLKYGHELVLIVEIVTKGINFSSSQKKQLVIESLKRIIVITSASTHLDPEVVTEFLDHELPELIDAAVWLANNGKIFLKHASRCCKR